MVSYGTLLSTNCAQFGKKTRTRFKCKRLDNILPSTSVFVELLYTDSTTAVLLYITVQTYIIIFMDDLPKWTEIASSFTGLADKENPPLQVVVIQPATKPTGMWRSTCSYLEVP